MKWVGDKLALLVTSIVCAAGAWALLHYSGQWFFLAATVIGLLLLYLDNRRLRTLLEKHGIDPRGK